MQRVKKSRRGCAACKQKKVKCDETKPSCLRCARLHRSCPGYNFDLKWSNKHEVLRNNELRGTVNEARASSVQAADQPQRALKSTTKPTIAPSSENEVVLQDRLGVEDSDDFALFLEDFWHAGEHGTINELLPSPLTVSELSADNTDKFTKPLLQFDKSNYLLGGQIQNPPGNSSSRSINGDKPLTMLPVTTVSRTLVHYDSVLVEYYFSSVASLYSCFDGRLNPFRTTISQFWSSSLVTKLTLQSMAAACLAREFPQLTPHGIHVSGQAIEQIYSEMRNGTLSDISFMCLIMLGQSACWQNESDLGLEHFSHANTLLRTSFSSKRTNLLPNTDPSFFDQALGYWRMILSFLSHLDDPENDKGSLSEDTCMIPQIVPHPWALIAPDMMNAISEVGRLVYSHRKQFRNKRFWKQSHVDEMTRMISKCREVEHTLLEHRLPIESEIVDTEDSTTPSFHLIIIAEAYRLVSLIQLYRVFPDVLLDRLNSTDHIKLFDNVPRLHFSASYHTSDDDAQKWLKRLALHTVDLLASLPYESHTKSIQAFLYVAISSELEKDSSTNIDFEALRVLQARNLVQGRLEGYRFIFAPKPAQRKLQLVLKIWEIMDTTGRPAFWLDVMLDNGLEVVFC